MNFLNQLLCAAALAVPVAAQVQRTLIIPDTVNAVTEASNNEPYAFGWDGFSTTSRSVRLQYVYDASHFDSVGVPITINRLRFRADAASTSVMGTGGTWTRVDIRLGYASTDYDALNTFYAQNFLGGVEPTPSYSGLVLVQPWSGNWPGNPGDWYVDLPLTIPFVYDPRTGDDFVLDIANEGVFAAPLSATSASDEDFGDGVRANLLRNITSWAQTDGFLGTQERAIVCEIGYTIAPGLHADFTVEESMPGPQQVVQFRDGSVTDDPAGLQTWLWDFDGDGLSDSTVQNPTWPFSSCGAHTVTLTVFDSSRLATRMRTDVVVVGPPRADFDVTWTGLRPVNAQFLDTSVGRPTSWAWDFDGDGLTDSTLPAPNFSYLSLGRRNVTLTVSNACGSDSITKPFDTAWDVGTQFFNESWNGVTNFTHFFDATIQNPAGITVTDLVIHSNQNGGTFVAIEVFTRFGGHSGFETNRGAWQSVGTANGIAGGFQGGTPIDVPDFFLGPGTWGVAIVYTAGGPRFTQSYRVGSEFGNQDVALDFGVMTSSPFGGTLFQDRVWNGRMRYCVGNGAGRIATLSAGCTNSTGAIASLTTRAGGVPTIGETLVFDVASAPANQPLAFVIVGVADLGGIDLGLIGMPGCFLRPEPLLSIPIPTSATGTASASLAISDEPITIGFPIFAQALIADFGLNPLGAALSSSLQGEVGCR